MAEHRQYLCMMSEDKIYGINLKKLIPEKEEQDEDENEEQNKEVEDWKNLPNFCFDFSKDLSLRYMHALELDSKIHLIGGQKCNSEDGSYKPSNKVYKLDFDFTDDDDDDDDDDNNKEEPQINESELIPQTPTYFGEDKCLVTKIRGDHYFLILDDAAPASVPNNNFWVLRSETREWEPLPAAPNPGIADDPEKGWTLHHDEDDFTSSFWLTIDDQRRFFTPHILPFPCLPGFDFDCCVTLSFFLEEEFTIHALLVTRLGVKYFQEIKGCFDEIPSFLRKVEPILLDLGDGKVCVMLCGFERKHGCGDRFLCVLVLSLAMKEGVEVNLLEYPPAERDFLIVNVISKSFYTLKEDPNEWRQEPGRCRVRTPCFWRGDRSAPEDEQAQWVSSAEPRPTEAVAASGGRRARKGLTAAVLIGADEDLRSCGAVAMDVE
ncbi:uncharacterized protein DS421_12g385190 [Arachis hypogaea]|nr:uncharacterized protein DS421_12g385190 [Arachis hypogaea]